MVEMKGKEYKIEEKGKKKEAPWGRDLGAKLATKFKEQYLRINLLGFYSMMFFSSKLRLSFFLYLQNPMDDHLIRKSLGF